MNGVATGLARVQGLTDPHPEVWRACRFIQFTDVKVSRFGVSHGLRVVKPRLIKRQPLATPATTKERDTTSTD